jgi:hypothetical protein
MRKCKTTKIGATMNDELYISILKKLYGAWDASLYFAESCEVCAETLVPFDTGLDPYTDTRAWMTKCCGVVHTYNQKLSPTI